jgi:hypothetical protein
MAPSLTGPCLRLAFAVALFSGCAAETFAPRNPGDSCLDVCPEGMHCRKSAAASKANGMAAGQCELDAGRCLTDVDCNNHVARCAGASASNVGYCNYPLPMGQ